MTRRVALLLVVLAGCPHSDDPVALDGPIADAPVPDAATVVDAAESGNPGFVVPTAVTKANTITGGTWTEVGDADWSCLGTPSADEASTGTIALTGRVVDFQTGNGVGNAEIMAWGTAPEDVRGIGNSSDVAATRGAFTMTLDMLPAGVTRYGFTITAPGFVTTRVIGRYYPPGVPATDELDAVSDATATALPAFIGVTRDPTRGMYVGRVRDCLGRAVSNAVVGVSSTSGAYTEASGGQTFYFSAGSSSLPVRHNVSPVLNKDGLFLVLDVIPITAGFVQVWGFRDTAELASGQMTLLAEARAGVGADMVVSIDLEPLRN